MHFRPSSCLSRPSHRGRPALVRLLHDYQRILDERLLFTTVTIGLVLTFLPLLLYLFGLHEYIPNPTIALSILEQLLVLLLEVLI